MVRPFKMAVPLLSLFSADQALLHSHDYPILLIIELTQLLPSFLNPPSAAGFSGNWWANLTAVPPINGSSFFPQVAKMAAVSCLLYRVGCFPGPRLQTGEGNGTPVQYSCLENPRDGGAWWAAVYGVAQSRTWLKRLSSSRLQTRKIFLSDKSLVSVTVSWSLSLVSRLGINKAFGPAGCGATTLHEVR